MKKIAAMVILLAAFLHHQQTYAQESRIMKKYKKDFESNIADDSDKLRQIRELIDQSDCDGDQDFLTSYFLNDTLTKYQNLISGTSVKDGKVAATSASIDEKSASLNFDAHLFDDFYGQINVTGQSDDGFVSIFDGGKYKRTVGLGGTINWFTKMNKIKYDCQSWYFLHNKLKSFDCTDTSGTPDTQLYIDKIDSFVRLYDKSDLLRRKAFDCDSLKINFTTYTLYNRLKAELKDILPAKWDYLDTTETNQFIQNLKDNTHEKRKLAGHLVATKRIVSVDNIQASGEWNTLKIQWFTVRGSWQQKQYQLLDVLNPTDFYTKNYVDNYFSGSVSYNYLWSNVRRKINIWTSPTIKVETKRDFSTDTMIHLQRQRAFFIGADTLTNIQKDASLHTKVPGPQTTLTVEWPLTIYFPKYNYGIEIAATAQLAPGIDNVGGRFGIYLPVDIQDGSAVIIEPLIRLNKLNQAGLNFLKEQLAFGFNVSVTIPKFLKN